MKLTRKRIFLCGVLCVGGAPFVWLGICRINSRPATVTLSWTYDYGKDPACSAARATNCIDHFEAEDITGTPQLLQSVPNPAKPFGRVNDIEATFRLGPPYGMRRISVIAVGKDGSGKRVTSDPNAATVTVKIPSQAPHGCPFQ